MSDNDTSTSTKKKAQPTATETESHHAGAQLNRPAVWFGGIAIGLVLFASGFALGHITQSGGQQERFGPPGQGQMPMSGSDDMNGGNFPQRGGNFGPNMNSDSESDSSSSTDADESSV